METVKNLIIGFGKGGKTLAKTLASHGEEVMVVEQSTQMYGGTCINVGCLPSKNMLINSERHLAFSDGVAHQRDLTIRLRQKNYHMLADEPTVAVVDGQAHFVADHQVTIDLPDGSNRQVEAARIFVNTGATPVIPEISGLTLSHRVITSKEALSLDYQPKTMAILGAGHIGLEFATMYHQYGTQVTVINRHDHLLGQYDEDVAQAVEADLKAADVCFKMNANLVKVDETDDQVYLTFADGQTLTVDTLLVASGRRPNTDQLGLDQTGIQLTDRGAIQVDEHLQTTVPNVWALGDVNGGPQFTYISLDDFRIVNNQLFGDGSRSTSDRAVVPTTTFLNPPLSAVGLSEKTARQQGFDIKVYRLAAAGIPKANVLEETRGLYKVIVDQKTSQILGAVIYAAESHEVINLVALAMKAKQPYTVLRDMIYTHPTMAEVFNDLLK